MQLKRTLSAITACLCISTALSQVINEDVRLANQSGSNNDYFGHSISISGSRVVVGAYYDYYNRDDIGMGAAFLFDSQSGEMLEYLRPNDGRVNDLFGWSVILKKDILVVGAMGHDLGGAVYIFDANSGTQLRKIIPDDIRPGDRFGYSVDLDGRLLAVGSPDSNPNGQDSGSVYLFDIATGNQLQKITPNDAYRLEHFGRAIAVDDGVLAVGKVSDESLFEYGSAYLFDTSTGAQLARIFSNEGFRGNEFGYSIALDNGILAVGARHDNNLEPNVGSAYLYDIHSTKQIAKLFPLDGQEDDQFGYSIAIHNNTVVVGARWEDGYRPSFSSGNSGSAYTFNATTGAHIAKFHVLEDEVHDYFGTSVSIDNDTIAVGASYEDTFTGAAYIFNGPYQRCEADFSNDYFNDVIDISIFWALMFNHNIEADFNEDGVLDFFDISAFLTSYTTGCP